MIETRETDKMDRESVIATLDEHGPEIRARGVTHLALFGSLARGEAGAGSDIDVVVDIEPGRKFSLIDQASLRVLLCDILGRDTEVLSREDLQAAFREAIAHDSVRVF